jgi:integrase/recombinase XerD
MLTAYRRHRKDCAHRNVGRKYRRCRCPVWADGFVRGVETRKSLGTRDWDEAQKIVRGWEAAGEVPIAQDEQPTTIQQANTEFLADAEARNLKDKTIYKYRFLFRQLTEFAQIEGIRFLKEFDPATLRRFRASWKDQNLAAQKKLERLRSFFRFSVQNGWISVNPASEIKSPKVTVRPTLPFSRDEMMRILTAIAEWVEECQPPGKANVRRLRALVLLLRNSGLRIGDAVSCSVDRLVNGKLRLYTQKTGTHVHCPLPEFVVKELQKIPKMSERYWFWTGNGKLQTAVGDWQGRLLGLFKGMKVKQFASVNKITEKEAREQLEAKGVKFAEGHAHRFRDTFAVELLLAGVPLERVAILLGHSSIKVTEKHYAPWVRERQEQAEADVKRTWAQDPIALLESKGTREVHEKRGPVN